QIRINEVCTSNNTVVLDEDGDSRDWVELYNAGNESVDLNGFYLSDKDNDTTKWQFGGITMLPESYLLVFISGKNRPATIPPHASFKLSQAGESLRLYDSFKTLVDSISVPFISTDFSYGSFPDGSTYRAFFEAPTPNGTNNNSEVTDHIIAFAPQFSHKTGVYSNTFSASISTNENDATIYYTLDGSEPNELSSVYTTPITINETTVVTAKTVKSGLIDSKIELVNYVFLENQSLPVICLSTDPDYFFDFETGIYVKGPNAEEEFPYYGANFWSNTEVPVNVQWIDEYGRLGFSQKLGVRIHGGSVSRTRPMRSLRLLARDDYGKGRIDYSLFSTKIQPSNKRFILRNSGSDYLKTMFRDGFIHNTFISNGLHADAVCYNPVEVYLNGEFWGIHNAREKVDRYYLQSNFGVDDDNVDMLEEQDQIMEGDFVAFDAMEAQVLGLDLSVDANFQIADSLFDVLNLADYYIAQTYINNLDWPYNNLKYWREKAVGAKWRYIIFDLDATLGGVSFAPVDFDNLERALGSFGDDNRHILIFRKLLENETYRQFFINRYCDLVNTAFSAQEFEKSLNKAAAKIEDVIPKHFNRWSPELNDWEEQVEIVKEYVNERPPFAINYLQDFFNLNQQANINLNVYPPNAGKIELNSVSVKEFPFKGVYFEEIPISIGITENPGFTFSHWETNRTDIDGSSAYSRQFYPKQGDSVTAVFVGNSAFSPLDVYPNPATNEINVNFVLN
ncbi:MAG: CotH kinase family protein, partial [Flavobacteriales bacterium]